MSDFNTVILYVASPPASAAFYETLLGRAPVEQSANFAMFALGSGVMLGLWAAHDVAPPATAPGGCELAIAIDDDDRVEALHVAWRDRGWTVLQAPTQEDFGYTFVVADPDGHRLRVFAPAA